MSAEDTDQYVSISGDDVYTYELTSTLDPSCDNHECEDDADRLYLGLTLHGDTAWTFPATYCDSCSEELGASDPHKTLIGQLTQTADDENRS